MTKREYDLMLNCKVAGCKEVRWSKYSSRKDYIEGKAFWKDGWTCLHHSRSVVTPENRSYEFTDRYRLTYRFTGRGYELTWKLNNGKWEGEKIWGEKWSAVAADFPAGAIITIYTTVEAHMPTTPEVMPEWRAVKLEYHDAWDVLKELDEDEKIVLSRMGILMVRRKIDNADAFRNLTTNERKGLYQHIKKGTRVIAKEWQSKDYHRYEWGWANHPATVIETDGVFCEVLTTRGKMLKVYVGNITPENEADSDPQAVQG